MSRYRILLGFALLSWLIFTLALQAVAQPYELPLVSFRFSNIAAAAWCITGGGLLVMVGRSVLRSHSAQEQWAGRYRALAAYLHEGMLICTAKGRVRWHNEAAKDLLRDDDTLAENVQGVLKRAQRTGGAAMQTLALREGMRFSVQAFPLDSQSYAIVCRPLQSVGTHNTFYESFIRRIVHDMRNPLAAIIGHAANLRQSVEVEPEAWRKSAATIEDEAQRLARLVDSMLFDARLAYVPLAPEMLDLADVLEEAVYAHDERAARDGKALEMESPSSTLPLEGDQDLLVRAFGNLIDNGLKYSGVNGRLCIRLEDQPGAYIVQFTDNGLGIPPEYLPDRIFEPLVRARAQGSGSGLGLSIARKIFEMHGGTISAQSRVGEGTTMTVRLPKSVEGVGR